MKRMYLGRGNKKSQRIIIKDAIMEIRKEKKMDLKEFLNGFDSALKGIMGDIPERVKEKVRNILKSIQVNQSDRTERLPQSIIAGTGIRFRNLEKDQRNSHFNLQQGTPETINQEIALGQLLLGIIILVFKQAQAVGEEMFLKDIQNFMQMEEYEKIESDPNYSPTISAELENIKAKDLEFTDEILDLCRNQSKIDVHPIKVYQNLASRWKNQVKKIIQYQANKERSLIKQYIERIENLNESRTRLSQRQCDHFEEKGLFPPIRHPPILPEVEKYGEWESSFRSSDLSAEAKLKSALEGQKSQSRKASSEIIKDGEQFKIEHQEIIKIRDLSRELQDNARFYQWATSGPVHELSIVIKNLLYDYRDLHLERNSLKKQLVELKDLVNQNSSSPFQITISEDSNSRQFISKIVDSLRRKFDKFQKDTDNLRNSNQDLTKQLRKKDAEIEELKSIASKMRHCSGEMKRVIEKIEKIDMPEYDIRQIIQQKSFNCSDIARRSHSQWPEPANPFFPDHFNKDLHHLAKSESEFQLSDPSKLQLQSSKVNYLYQNQRLKLQLQNAKEKHQSYKNQVFNQRNLSLPPGYHQQTTQKQPSIKDEQFFNLDTQPLQVARDISAKFDQLNWRNIFTHEAGLIVKLTESLEMNSQTNNLYSALQIWKDLIFSVIGTLEIIQRNILGSDLGNSLHFFIGSLKKAASACELLLPQMVQILNKNDLLDDSSYSKCDLSSLATDDTVKTALAQISKDLQTIAEQQRHNRTLKSMEDISTRLSIPEYSILQSHIRQIKKCISIPLLSFGIEIERSCLYEPTIRAGSQRLSRRPFKSQGFEIDEEQIRDWSHFCHLLGQFLEVFFTDCLDTLRQHWVIANELTENCLRRVNIPALRNLKDFITHHI